MYRVAIVHTTQCHRRTDRQTDNIIWQTADLQKAKNFPSLCSGVSAWH